VAPVLTLAEAPADAHLRARSTYLADEAGVVHPAPAPRFGGTPLAPPTAPSAPGTDTDAVLAELGYAATEVAALRDGGVVA
jgi:alpha-methylacyl-CoA racemase